MTNTNLTISIGNLSRGLRKLKTSPARCLFYDLIDSHTENVYLNEVTMEIINWIDRVQAVKKDEKVGIRIATLFESDGRGTFVTILPPGAAVSPHYHEDGCEEYHIISGSGQINLKEAGNPEAVVINKQVDAGNSFVIPPMVIHQLVNIGTDDLTLIFSCPLTHLKNDRFVVERF